MCSGEGGDTHIEEKNKWEFEQSDKAQIQGEDILVGINGHFGFLCYFIWQ